MQIWKYKVDVGANCIVAPHIKKVCQGAYLKYSNGEGMFIWCMIDPKTPKISRTVHVVGTGWDLPDNSRYCGSIITPGNFVWHVLLEQ